MRAASILVVIGSVAAAAGVGAGKAAQGRQGDLGPTLSAITVKFVEEKKESDYSATIASTAKPAKGTWTWTLSPPANNPTCKNFDGTADAQQGSDASHWQVSAIWHHADTDGCDHSLGTEHEGTVYLKVTVGNETCAASVFGTLDTTGPAADCTFSKDCGIFLEGLAGARAKLKALKDEYDRLKSDQKFLDGWAQIASGDKAIARAKALEAKAKTDPAAAKEFAEYKKAAATLLKDIFRVQSDIESVGQQIEEATLSVNDASDALAKCQSGRFLATAGMRASCDDEASALGDAQGRRDAYADVRRLVSRTLPAKLKTDGTRTSRALGSFVRLLPSASAGARPFAAQLTRLLKGSSLLGAWSRTLDSRLAAAKAQVATASDALTACQNSGG